MSIWEWILDIVYPPRCVLCSKILADGEKNLCGKCADTLPRLLNSECRRDIKNIGICIAPFQYKDEVRESLHRYKFDGVAAYGRVYADFIVKSIDENAIICDIISWVPLNKRGFRKRGYDQAELIARALAEKLGVPCKKLLIKSKNNKRQSSLKGKEARKRNVSGVYSSSFDEDIRSKKILLIDDIVTTGATLEACASVLKAEGCHDVNAAAVAMVK